MNTHTSKIIVIANHCGTCGTDNVQVHHENFPELRVMGVSSEAAAERLLAELELSLEAVSDPFHSDPVREAIADLQAFLKREGNRGEGTKMNTVETPTIGTTVGELVARRPSRSRVFEKLGIDYCCGGKKPLSEACADKDIDASTVLTILLASEDADTSAERDWTRASLSDLSHHIEQTHHAFLKRELPRLEAIVHRVAAVHGDRHPWLLEFEGVYTHFAKEMVAHMMKEEQVLFPLIRRLESGEAGSAGHGVGNPIHVMEDEHDDAARSLARMGELSAGFTPPADACNTFRAMLDGLSELEAETHRHVHKENSILFPKALELERHGAPHMTSGAVS